MPDARVEQTPGEDSAEFLTVVGLDSFVNEQQLREHMIHEI
tara:strand:- start:3074 stop:3196 length:123 start_codon:yes stop_codon:yes gene_type:complete